MRGGYEAGDDGRRVLHGVDPAGDPSPNHGEGVGAVIALPRPRGDGRERGGTPLERVADTAKRMAQAWRSPPGRWTGSSFPRCGGRTGKELPVIRGEVVRTAERPSRGFGGLLVGRAQPVAATGGIAGGGRSPFASHA